MSGTENISAIPALRTLLKPSSLITSSQIGKSTYYNRLNCIISKQVFFKAPIMHTKQIRYNVRCDVCAHMLLGISVLGVIIIIIIHNYCCNKINILVTTSSLLQPLAIPTSYIFMFPWTFYLYKIICKILKLSNVIIRQLLLQLPQTPNSLVSASGLVW